MKKLAKLILILFSLYVALNGCAVEKRDPPKPFTAAPAVISSSMEAAQAFAAVLQARDLYVTSANMLKDLGEFSLNVMATDPSLAGTGTDIQCEDGGTYKYTGTTTGTAYDLTLTFSGCRQHRFQFEGQYLITAGTPTDITVQLGNGSTFNIFYFDDAYTVLIDYLKAQSTYTMSGSGTASDAAYSLTPSGTITSFDYFLLDTFTMNYAGAKIDYLLSTDPFSGDQTTSLFVNGSFTETARTWGLSILLTGFSIEQVKKANPGGGSFYAKDTSLGGSVAFDYRPNDHCFEGGFSVATTTPVRTDYGLARTTQGLMTINGIATAQYNASGDIDVSLTGSSPINYPQEAALMRVCDYSAMEDQIPPLLGPTGTAVGSTMAVTLTWYGPNGSSSDMDLHVKYYDRTDPYSAPTATQETWHIDWHQGKTYPGATGSCSDPGGLSFSDAFDLDGNHTGTCDVGLDFDDTNGYGPEHITALKLPVGYYIVSVDSYSLHGDPSATLYLAIHIGDYVFGPYSSTLTTSDGEGTSPGAWYRVADVRVNADGTVDVLTPNATLTPWH